ncbi:HD domain-containing protein [Leptolinea tardivitalis]|uniref:HD domain-containing protein n=1 Tax=Leptolinea tardivitalis TaxID=229920 RepID=A0A0P6XJC5_9CHLR|nr:HD domain-containing protein [Leptolinea tardivitalis]KPL75109.1 hypothetical protein ADM99_00365 [Leptolinea tardivitalis]GAP20413.1 predicted HD superfamily hydrolase [Leptolinea tardivitalis]
MLTVEQARAFYSSEDAVHDFDHVLRVYRTAMKLGKEEGADLDILQAAALLHDSRGAEPGGAGRAQHHIASAVFAGEVLENEGWSPERIKAVQHAIRAHRYRGKEDLPETIEAKVLFDSDKLDVIGAIGTARTIAYSVLAGEPMYEHPSEQFRTTGCEVAGEHHSSYHEYLFKLCKVKDRLFTASARRMAEQRHAAMTSFFEQLAAEYEGLL